VITQYTYHFFYGVVDSPNCDKCECDNHLIRSLYTINDEQVNGVNIPGAMN